MSLAAVTPQLATVQLAFLDGIGFDPFFRGLLSVIAAFLVLIGGTYLVVATDVGTRLGFLVSAAGLFGWMFLMGIIWTIYGIGWRGDPPVWDLVAIIEDDAGQNDDGVLFSEIEGVPALTETEGGSGLPIGGLGQLSDIDTEALLADLSDEAPEVGPGEEPLLSPREAAAADLAQATLINDIADLDLAQAAALQVSDDLELGEFRYLITSDGVRGEAQASADAFLVEEEVFEPGEYLPLQFGAFIIDGKPVLDGDAGAIDRVTHTLSETILHPTFDREIIVIQVQAVVKEATLPGQAPPVSTVDPETELVSVVMERNRGGPFPSIFSGLRYTPAMFTVISGLLFAVLALNLHWRDQREAEIRDAA